MCQNEIIQQCVSEFSAERVQPAPREWQSPPARVLWPRCRSTAVPATPGASLCLLPSFSSLQEPGPEPSVSQCHHPNALPGVPLRAGEGRYSHRGEHKLELGGPLWLHQGFCCPHIPPRSLSLIPDPIRSLLRVFPRSRRVSPQAGASQRRAWGSTAGVPCLPLRSPRSTAPCPCPPAASPRPWGAVPTACSCRPPPPACTAGTPRSSTTAPGSGTRR